jgi:hypothetical protein
VRHVLNLAQNPRKLVKEIFHSPLCCTDAMTLLVWMQKRAGSEPVGIHPLKRVSQAQEYITHMLRRSSVSKFGASGPNDMLSSSRESSTRHRCARAQLLLTHEEGLLLLVVVVSVQCKSCFYRDRIVSGDNIDRIYSK